MSEWIEAAESIVPEGAGYARALLLSEYLRRDVIREAVRSIALPPGSRGLDAGCGIGGPSVLLAREVGGGGHVTGVDVDEEMLFYAGEIAGRCGFEDLLTFDRSDIADLPYDDGEFDWLASIDCFGYPSLAEPAESLSKLSRVVRPGGTVALMGWTSQQVLPGYPALEAALNRGSSLVLHGRARGVPETSFAAAPGWFQACGMRDVTCRTYAGDVPATPGGGCREAMLSLFDMLWGKARDAVSAAEWSEFLRLCRGESPGCILDSPGYHGFFTYTVVSGRKRHEAQ